MESSEADPIYEDYLPAVITFVIVIITAFFMLTKDASKRKCLDALVKQTVEAESGVRESVYANDFDIKSKNYVIPETIFEVFMTGMQKSNDGPCFGHRDKMTGKYVWKSYSEIYNLAARFGSALLMKGLKPADTTRIGLFAYNCPEWNIVAQACSMFSMTLIPFHDSFRKEMCTYIVNQTGVSLIVCGNWMKARFLMEKSEYTPNLNYIVIINNDDFNTIVPSAGLEPATISTQVVQIAKKVDVEIMSFEEMLYMGLREAHNLVLPKPDTVCTITYTSGTTGDPKGVVLTHKSFMSIINGIESIGSTCDWIPKKKIYLSYLSAAQSFERLNQLLVLNKGGKIGFSEGDFTKFLDEIQELRPSLLIVVPRILNHIYEKIFTSIKRSGTLRLLLFRFAIWRKLRLLKRGEITRNTIWDLLLFDKIQMMMGGRLEMMASGAAALNEHVMDFMRATLGCQIHEGYGQTESCGPTTLTLPYEYKSGVVGPPLPNLKIKLIDVEELGFSASNNIGEICIKGDSVMKEYFKDPTRTRTAIDDDGFLHTGDIGSWDKNGALKIVDRMSQIFKLAHGEFISPEMIENVYKNNNFILQIYVDGNSRMSRPVAIVVPSEGYLLMWVNHYLGKELTFYDACRDPVVKEVLLTEMMVEARIAKLKDYEQVKNIFVTSTLFTIDNGLMTPTRKIKRSAMRKKYNKELAKLFETPNYLS